MLRDGPRILGSNELPPSRLLQLPFAEISRNDWIKQVSWALALRGNFIGRAIERDATGWPVQVQPIPNDSAEVKRLPSGELEYRFFGAVVPYRDVVHCRFQSVPGQVFGLSPIQSLSPVLGNALAQLRHQESWFLNSAAPAGVIEVQGSLDRAETRKMKRSWDGLHQGLNNANQVAILTEGARFSPVTINPAESQLLEALQYSAQEIIGQAYRIPAHMLGIRDQSPGHGGQSIEILERSFINNCLQAYLDAIGEMLTSLHPRGSYVMFDVAERVRASTGELATAAQQLALGGIARPNDLRPWFNLDSVPDGDHMLLPPNAMLMEQALKALTEPTPDSPPPPANYNGSGENGGMDRQQAIDVIERAIAQSRSNGQ